MEAILENITFKEESKYFVLGPSDLLTLQSFNKRLFYKVKVTGSNRLLHFFKIIQPGYGLDINDIPF